MPLLPPPTPDEPVHRFADPAAELGALATDFGLDTEVEAIRRAHIGHEAAVNAVGLLHFLGAFVGLIASVGLLALAATANWWFKPEPWSRSPVPFQLFFGGLAAVYLSLTALNLALAYGLWRLLPWARWSETVFLAISLLLVAVNGLALGTQNSLMGMVFVAETVLLPISLLLVAVNGLALGTQDPLVGVVSIALAAVIPGSILFLMLSPKGTMVFSDPYKAIIAKTPHIRYRTSLLVNVVRTIFVVFIVLAIIAALFIRR